jgi:hypothetical protein
MSSEAVEYWSLFVVTSIYSIVPMYPSWLLLWVTIGLIWDRRYGPSWCQYNRKTRTYKFLILDFLVCFPFALVCMLAVILSKGASNE